MVSKEEAVVIDGYGKKHEVFLYAIDKGSKRKDHFDRVPGDLKVYIESAKKLRGRLKSEFPNAEIA
jgi:hypothetical protein